MTWWQWALFVVLFYLAIGVAITRMLRHTPFANNPLWMKVLMWWAFL